LKLKDFLNNKLRRDTIILSELPKKGYTIVEQLENASKFCNCAIILMTRDDEMRDSGMRARQNVVHEIGFFQGKYGRENVMLVTETGLDLFSNISGILRIEFDPAHFEEVFEALRTDLSLHNIT
jgi:predicted nucleotide-binding protein